MAQVEKKEKESSSRVAMHRERLYSSYIVYKVVKVTHLAAVMAAQRSLRWIDDDVGWTSVVAFARQRRIYAEWVDAAFDGLKAW